MTIFHHNTNITYLIQYFQEQYKLKWKNITLNNKKTGLQHDLHKMELHVNLRSLS